MTVQVMRRCRCGQLLSNYNQSDLCFICRELQAIIDRDAATDADRIRFAARHVAGVYGRPQDFVRKADYLLALSCVLDELCEATGLEPFRIENAPWATEEDEAVVGEDSGRPRVWGSALGLSEASPAAHPEWDRE